MASKNIQFDGHQLAMVHKGAVSRIWSAVREGAKKRKKNTPKCYAASEGTALRPTEKETYSSFLCIHEPTTKFKISHVKLGDHLEKKAGIKHLTFVKSPAGSAHLLQHPSSYNGKHRNLQTRTENSNLS